MGGNALKKVKTIRLEREQYLQYEREITEMIRPLVSHFHIPRTFPGKESFGDLDIVYISEDPNFLSIVKELLQSKDSFHNGDVTSVEYKNFQVDFIQSRLSYFQNHCSFLDYNDFGGILGQMTSRYELKYGFDGLFLKVHRDHVREHHLGEVLLSSDPVVIFDYLGLDHRRFEEEGFQTPVELYDFLTTCHYCSMVSYTHENINTVHRRRLTHRPVYQQFIEYISSHPHIPSQPALPYLTTPAEHASYLLRHFQCEDAYEDIVRRDEEARVVKAKFNGAIVTQVTGLEGKEIGKLMIAMKEHIFRLRQTERLCPSESQSSSTEDPPNMKAELEEEFHRYLFARNEDQIVELIREVFQVVFVDSSRCALVDEGSDQLECQSGPN
jgi:hypothetical protein